MKTSPRRSLPVSTRRLPGARGFPSGDKFAIPTPLGRLVAFRKGEELISLSLPSRPPRSFPATGFEARSWPRILGLEELSLARNGYGGFPRAVWRTAASIPWGETRTYGWVAARIGRPRAVRAVGTALAANPWPLIVPCHRVVRKDGLLGGFSAGAGWKEYLIGLEARFR